MAAVLQPASQVWQRLSARGRSMRVPASLRTEPLIFVVALVAALVYGLYSVWRYVHYVDDYDLAIFDQAIWHYSHFELAASSIRGLPNVLGDHFHPILVTLAPLYWIWSDPRMLLIAQAALVAASIVPVFLFARSRIGRLPAYLLSLAYAFSWPLITGVSYDFHELAFAPLLVALCILFGDQRRWRAFYISVALLLLTKENMGLLVVFMGLWLALRGERKRAAAVSGIGLVSFVLTVNVIIPAFGSGSYEHWLYSGLGKNGSEAIKTLVHYPGLLFHKLIDDPAKTRLLTRLIVPFLGLMIYSPLAILMIPLILQQLLADSPALWSDSFHYWLPIAPILAMAAADGFRNLTRLANFGRRTRWVAVAAFAVILAANYKIATRYPLWHDMTNNFTLAKSPEDKVRDAAVRAIPANASVVTDSLMLPHVSERAHVYFISNLPPNAPKQFDYVLYSEADLTAFSLAGRTPPRDLDVLLQNWVAEAHAWRDAHLQQEYRQIYSVNGLMVWKRKDLR